MEGWDLFIDVYTWATHDLGNLFMVITMVVNVCSLIITGKVYLKTKKVEINTKKQDFQTYKEFVDYIDNFILKDLWDSVSDLNYEYIEGLSDEKKLSYIKKKRWCNGERDLKDVGGVARNVHRDLKELAIHDSRNISNLKFIKFTLDTTGEIIRELDNSKKQYEVGDKDDVNYFKENWELKYVYKMSENLLAILGNYLYLREKYVEDYKNTEYTEEIKYIGCVVPKLLIRNGTINRQIFGNFSLSNVQSINDRNIKEIYEKDRLMLYLPLNWDKRTR